MRRILSSLLLLALPSTGHCWWSVTSTHYKISESAVNSLSGADYPDMRKFGDTIIKATSGKGNDAVAHGLEYNPDAGKYDGGPFSRHWDTGNKSAKAKYNEFLFTGDFNAYYRIGSMAHLVQDQAVPAHAANIYHAKAFLGIPLNPDPLESFMSGYGPGAFEARYSGKAPLPYYYDENNLTHSIIYQTQSNLPFWTHADLSGDTTQYWFENPSQKYIGAAFDGNWGYYGPSPYTYSEWSQASQKYITVTDSPEIATGQIAEAAGYSAGLLMAVSQSLPPLISAFNVSSGPVNSPSGNQIVFTLMENRLPDVKIDLFVQETGQPIITTGLIKRLPYNQSDNGTEYYADSPDAITWTAKYFSLYPTLSSDLGLLPQMASFQLEWSGEVEGARLEPREEPYTLVIRVTDHDGNNAESSYNFTMRPDITPPTVQWTILDKDGTQVTQEVTGSNSLEIAPWFHTGYSTGTYISFQFQDSGTGVGNFSIYPPSATEEPVASIFSAAFHKGQSFLLSDFTLQDDATGYLLAATDSLGNATTVYFHLDRQRPEIHISTIVVHKIPGTYSMDVYGAANDSLAGLGVPVRLASTIVRPTGSPPPYYNYDSGQPWPPGPFKEDFSFTDLLATPSPSVDGTIVHDFHITDRSGLQMQTSMVASYGLFSSGIPDRWEPLEPSLPQPLILGEVIFKVEDVPSFGSCTRLDVPVGMRSKLILEPRNPDPQEIANLNNWLSLFSDTYIQEDYTPIASTSTLFDVSSPTVIAKDFDMVLPRYVKFSTVGYGNTNSVRVQCTYDSDGDGIMDGTYISTMPPGSFFYESGGTVTVKGFALSGPMDQGYAEVVPSGLNVRMVSGSLEIIFSEVLEGGKIFVQRATSYPEIPGYRIDKDNAWDLVVSANYRDLQIKACMNTGALAESQISNAELYHYNSGSGTWEKVTTGRENGCVKGFSQTASPFVVMVPVYDVTAPETSIGFKQGEQRIVDGNFYLSTDTYVNYYAGDLTMRGDISGVATMYSLIDIDPAPGCLATPFDPTALKGTCANPFYTEPFKLAEGIHSLYYFSSDKSFNVESFKSERVYADGTAPETEIAAAGIILAAGTTAAYITDIDSVSITATDPVSNGVASGRKGLLCLINVPPQECAGVQEDPGAPRGTCANPAYASPFSLPVGTHTVYYTAEDNVGNEAEIKSIGVIVGPKIVVTAAAVSTSAIVWSWEPVAGATSYELRSSTGAGISGALPVSATFYLQTGLSPNTLYGNYLKIHSGAGDFVSAVSSAATLADQPGFSEAFSFGQNASLVIGQTSFNSRAYGTAPDKLSSPGALAFDDDGALWVTDRGNNRVLKFSPSFMDGMSASLVIGQTDFYDGSEYLPSAARFDRPAGMAFDLNGNLWMMSGGGRLLRFSPPFSNGMSADMIIGNTNFTSRNGGCSQNQFGGATWGKLTFDGNGALWMADFNYSRVLRFSPPLSTGMGADLVIGQPNFVTCSASGPTAFNMHGPLDVKFGSEGGLWVSDYWNDRILKYMPPFYTGMPASVVLGQNYFSVNNAITGLSQPSASSLKRPAGLEVDGFDNLWATDTGSNRILKYRPPFSTGMAASLALGQNDFVSQFNMNMQAGFSFPFDVGMSGFITSDSIGRLWVADQSNNRILMFDPIHAGIFSSVGSSSFTVSWLGGGNPAGTEYLAEISRASDFSSGLISSGYLTGSGFTFSGLEGGVRYYARVKARNVTGLDTGWAGLNSALTAPSPVTDLRGEALSPDSIRWTWSEAKPGIKFQIFSSTGGAVSEMLPGNAAYYVQTGLAANTAYSCFIRSINSVGTAESVPASAVTLSMIPGLVMPFSSGQDAFVVIGQTDFVSRASGLSASKLSYVRDTKVDKDGAIWAVDTNNCRVLRYTPPFATGMAADLVIGQTDFNTGSCAAGAGKLNHPEKMAFDVAGRLWVSDTGNNRILRYTPPFANGMAADLVIGQADFSQSSYWRAENRLSMPSSLAFDPAGGLWVSDKQNYRVLRFSPPFTNGMSADLVLGQPNFLSANDYEGADNSIRYPGGLSFDKAGNLWAMDSSTARTLKFSPPFSTFMNASLSFGQYYPVPSAESLAGSPGIEIDPEDTIYISDTGYDRVLAFTPLFHKGMSADVVLGQEDFVSSYQTHNIASGRDKLRAPQAVEISSATGDLWVADGGNNRVMGFHPVNLVFDVYSDSAAVKWSDGGNPAGVVYKTYLSGTPSFENTVSESPWFAGTAYVFEGLIPETTYYARVRSMNTAGIESAARELGSFTTKKRPDIITASTVTINGVPEVSISAAKQTTVILTDLTSSSGTVALAAATTSGLTLVGNLYDIRPEGIYEPLATLTFYYSTATLTSLGLWESDIGVYEYFASSGWVRLPNQAPDDVNHKITVPITQIASLFGIFGVVTDRLAPVTELKIPGTVYTTPDDKVYISGKSSITLEAYDPVVYGTSTGVAFIEYRMDPGTSTIFIPYVLPFSLSEGFHIVEYRSRDNAGNLEVIRSTAVYADSAAPATESLLAGTMGQNGWNVSPVAASLVSEDNLSGVSGRYYKIVGEPALPPSVTDYMSYSAPVDFAGEGGYALYYYAVDNIGNTEEVKSKAFRIDLSTPQATMSILPAPNAGGWHSAPVEVAFAGTDTVSGIEYCSSSFTIMGEGENIPASGYCMDYAGWSSTAALTINIDTTAPVAYSLLSPLPNTDGWNTSAVSVVFRGSDTLSGTEECSSTTVTVEGKDRKIAGWCRDLAGNIGYSTATLNIDLTQPVVSAAQVPVPNTYGWNKDAVEVSFAGADALSGIAYCEPAKTISAEGAGQTVTGYCADYAGNSSTVSITLNIDRTEPRITISSPVAGNLFAAGKNKVEIHLSVDDNLDPAPAVTAVLIQTEDKGAPRGSRPAILAVINGQILDPMDIDDGLWRLEVTAKDIAENSTQAVSGLFEVIHDTIAPETSLLVGEPKFTDTVTFINSGTPLTFSTTDDLLVSGDRQGSGAALTYVARDGGTPAAVPGELFISLEGVHNLAYYSADKAGNTEAAKLAQFSVDNSAPETSHSIFGPVFENAVGLYVSTSSVISFSSVEPLSAGAASGFAAIFIADSTDTYTVSSASFTAAEGAHFYSYYAKDKLGNTEPVRTLALIADGTPPVSAMVFSSAPASGASGRLIISSDTYIGFTRQDALSGVEAVWYSLDNATAAVVVGSITLPVGLHDVSYWSVDNVGNTETAHKVSLQVGVALQNVTINFTPSIINLKSEGGYIAAALSVSSACEAGFDAETIRIIKINDIALAAPIYAIVEHKDKDVKKNTGHSEKPHNIIIKFDRQALIAVLPVDRMVKVTVEGAFDDDSAFTAEDYLRVINPVRVSKSHGEKVRHQSKAFVDIPAKALKADTDITVVVMAECDAERREREERAEAKNLKRRGEVYEFGPEGTVFDVPVVISLPYDPLEAGKEKPAIAYWNPSKNDWEPLESELDPVEKVVKAKVGHFSLYQVVAPAPAPGDAAPSRSGDNSGAGVLTVSGADATFRLGEVYVFPNPAKGAQVPTFHIETGIADSVSIRIYTVSGRAAHEHTLAGLPAEVDDGNGLSYAYEYAWRDHIPSGVYYYHVEAKKGGQKLKKAGKFAVVR